MLNTKVITLSLLVVKVLRVLIILAFLLVLIFIVVKLFHPMPFTIGFPVTFEVHEIKDQNSEKNTSFHKVEVGPLKMTSGEQLVGNL